MSAQAVKSLEFFTYSPLTEQDSIRLLLLHQAREIEDDLYVKIIHTTLSMVGDLSTDACSYTALSYFWGPQEDRKTVYVDSKQLLIGPNLHNALCHLRQKHADIFVWADGLSINQGNVQERNHQVHHMRDIYSKASRTVVYLGEQAGNTSLSAWNYLERESGDPELRASREKDVAFRGGLEDVEIDVLTRPWFSRVWVLQEVVVSKNIIVQCGTRSVPWDNFCKVVLLQPRLNDRYGFSLRRKKLYEFPGNMFQARACFFKYLGLQHLLPPWYGAIEHPHAKDMFLLDMLCGARGLNATDPRDKVFALLGISSAVDRNADGVMVDYSKSFVAVYEDLAQYMINYSQTYDVLSHVQHGVESLSNYFSTPNKFNFPSWVPDWRLPSGMPRTILSTLEEENELQQQQRQLLVQKSHHWSQGEGRLMLVCSGRVIGRITARPMPIVVTGQDELEFEGLRQKFKDQPKRLHLAILEKWAAFPRKDRGKKDEYVSIAKEATSGIIPDLSRCGVPARSSSPFFTSYEKRYPDSCAKFYEYLRASIATRHRKTNCDKPEREPETQSEEGAQDQPILLRHLFERSRQTVFWTDDQSLALERIKDDSSILEGRSFTEYIGLVGRQGKNDKREISDGPEQGLALVPYVRRDDLIIALDGGRVPFVARAEYGWDEWIPDQARRGASRSPSPTKIACRLIGECLIDDFELFDQVTNPQEAHPANGATLFTFGSWSS